MLIQVTPSIHRPWREEGGFYSCDYFPTTLFTELSPSLEVRQLRDALGRWRSVRGVEDSLGEAVLCPARAVRVRDPHAIEGILIYGGSLGVLLKGVGDPGMGSPILWVEDIRDVPRAVATTLRETLDGEETDAGHVPTSPAKD